MAVYLHHANLIVNKEAILEKYKGGIIAFRRKYINEKEPFNQEDDYLFSVSRWNIDEFDIDELAANGLSYNAATKHSEDFVLHARLEGFLWDTPWIKTNQIFGWHINAGLAEIAEANRISNLPYDQIVELQQKGRNLLATIVIPD